MTQIKSPATNSVFLPYLFVTSPYEKLNTTYKNANITLIQKAISY